MKIVYCLTIHETQPTKDAIPATAPLLSLQIPLIVTLTPQQPYAIETVATVTESVADTAATKNDAAAVVVTLLTVATQATTSVLRQQPLLSHVV